MSIEKVKNWTKKHWKKLAVGGGVIIGGTALYLVGKKSGKLPVVEIPKPILDMKYKDLDIPENLSSCVESINYYDLNDNWVDIWTKDSGIKLEDLGKFGEAVKELNPNFEIIQGMLTATKAPVDIVEKI